jgi:cytochrome c-type biogenesis protein CcmH/NrfG
MSRSERAFAIMAVALVVFLVLGAVGTAVFDRTSSGNGDDDLLPTSTTGVVESDEYEQELRATVTADPSNAQALAALGNYLALTGQMTEAITWYEKALDLEPENWDVRLDFARSLADNGKRNDAELQFKKVTEGDPSNPQAHYYLAELYRNWVPARTEEAAAEYRKTVEVGAGTFVADQAAQALIDLGYASPVASTVTPSTEATP